MKSQIESLLFIATKPLSIRDLAKFLDLKKKAVQENLQLLIEEYNKEEKGIRIIKIEQKFKTKYQMATSPENSELVNKFTKQELNKELTKPSLETLTIIAYKGPITKPELEKIRGVNCSLILRNLMIRDLIEEVTDKSTGEFYYNVSPSFIKWLGISEVKELPDYDKLRNDENLEKILEQPQESPPQDY